MLFDRDEDGVLSFQELQVVMKSMGERPSGKLRYVQGCKIVSNSFIHSIREGLKNKIKKVWNFPPLVG